MAQHIKIHLSERVEVILNQLINKRKIEKSIELRIKIVLMSSKNISYEKIKTKLSCSEPTIAFWKQRWHNNYEKLQIFISGVKNEYVKDNKIKKEILIILGDAPRIGAPIKFTEAIQKKIIAIACESPEKYDLPFTNWTHEELAKQVINMDIVDTISARHLGRLLKKTT